MTQIGQHDQVTLPETRKEPEIRQTTTMVVGVDGSERNTSAIRWAAMAAAQSKSALLLLTAVEADPPTPYFPAPTDSSPGREVVERARRHAEAAQGGIDIRTKVEIGSPSKVLVQTSSDKRILVLGRRGLGGFTRLMVGSVSIATAGRAKGAVVVVPDGWDQLSHEHSPIVVGIDVAAPDSTTIRFAFEQARQRGTSITAVAAWDVHPVYSWDPVGIASRYADCEDVTAEGLRTILRPFRREFPEVMAHSAVRHGHPGRVLLDASTAAQMIVVGASHEGVLGGLPLGSNTRAILHHAPCPVAIIHAPDHQE